MRKNTLVKLLLCASALLISAFVLCGCGSGADSVKTVEGADERCAGAYADGCVCYSELEEYGGFWDVSAAYACLGDEIYGHAADLSGEEENHRGAVILSVIMLGGNPYSYEGRDLVAELLDHGTGGSFAIPVLNFIGLQAAGAAMDEETEAAYVDYCCGQLGELSLGPDIGGWSAVALIRYVDNPKYSDKIAKAVETYISVTSDNLSSGTMGSEGITNGCVVTGLTALTSAGLGGYNVLEDSPWKEADPLQLMYENLTNGEENVSDYYKSQYYLEFADLYRVLYLNEPVTWVDCGVNAAKLAELKAEAEQYKDDKVVASALAAAEGISGEDLDKKVPSWGNLYYNLFDAVSAAR